MLLTALSPSQIDLILPGKRTVQSFLVRRRTELMVAERTPADLCDAARVLVRAPVVPSIAYEQRHPTRFDPWDGEVSVNVYQGLAGGTCLVQAKSLVAEAATEAGQRSTYHRILNLPEPTTDILETVPPARRIVHDHGSDTDIALIHATADCAVIGQRIYGPVREPYISVEIGVDTARFESFRIRHVDPLQLDGHYNTFPLSRLEDAFELAREFGATPADIDRIEDNFEIDVPAPQFLRYDPVAPGLLAAAIDIRRLNENVLHRLSFDQIASWVHLRDAIPAFQLRLDTDVDAFAVKVKTAYAMLRKAGQLGRYHHTSKIEPAIAAYDNRPRDPFEDDMAVLEIPAR